jgi:hypothetical protein
MMLAENGERIHPLREFFRAELRAVKILMDHVKCDDVVVIDTDEEATEAEIYYHPSVMPKRRRNRPVRQLTNICGVDGLCGEQGDYLRC